MIEKLKKIKKKEPNVNKAKIQLVIFLAFMAFAFAYSKILVTRINKNDVKNNLPTINESISLSSLNNYDFDLKITVLENNNKTNYTYKGNITNDNGNISINNDKYIILDNEYYDKSYNKKEDIFYSIDTKYLNLSYIANYLKEENLVDNTYEIKLDVIVNNKLEQVLVYADKRIDNNELILTIDYTNLVKLENKNINSYIAEYQLYNFA